MKNTVLFCTGESGSGKSTFIEKFLSGDNFYNLKSATTRPMRKDGKDKDKYYFHDESYFDDAKKFATLLWVNEQFWEPGKPKWLYGVPEFEIFDHMGANFTYDVIQPRYVRQMIDWFNIHKLDKQYDFRILWFQPLKNSEHIVKSRQNMPNDTDVRKANTCDLNDFKDAKLIPDHVVISHPRKLVMDGRLRRFLNEIKQQQLNK